MPALVHSPRQWCGTVPGTRLACFGAQCAKRGDAAACPARARACRGWVQYDPMSRYVVCYTISGLHCMCSAKGRCPWGARSVSCVLCALCLAVVCQARSLPGKEAPPGWLSALWAARACGCCFPAPSRVQGAISPCSCALLWQHGMRGLPRATPHSLRSLHAAEQRCERLPANRVGISSISVDPLKPMFATGGADPLGGQGTLLRSATG